MWIRWIWIRIRNTGCPFNASRLLGGGSQAGVRNALLSQVFREQTLAHRHEAGLSFIQGSHTHIHILRALSLSVAEPDPRSGIRCFLPLDLESGISFLRIPNPQPIFLRA